MMRARGMRALVAAAMLAHGCDRVVDLTPGRDGGADSVAPIDTGMAPGTDVSPDTGDSFDAASGPDGAAAQIPDAAPSPDAAMVPDAPGARADRP